MKLRQICLKNQTLILNHCLKQKRIKYANAWAHHGRIFNSEYSRINYAQPLRGSCSLHESLKGRSADHPSFVLFVLISTTTSEWDQLDQTRVWRLCCFISEQLLVIMRHVQEVNIQIESFMGSFSFWHFLSELHDDWASKDNFLFLFASWALIEGTRKSLFGPSSAPFTFRTGTRGKTEIRGSKESPTKTLARKVLRSSHCVVFTSVVSIVSGVGGCLGWSVWFWSKTVKSLLLIWL